MSERSVVCTTQQIKFIFTKARRQTPRLFPSLSHQALDFARHFPTQRKNLVLYFFAHGFCTRVQNRNLSRCRRRHLPVLCLFTTQNNLTRVQFDKKHSQKTNNTFTFRHLQSAKQVKHPRPTKTWGTIFLAHTPAVILQNLGGGHPTSAAH